MTKNEFYLKLQELAPFNSQKLYYRDILSEALKLYKTLLIQLDFESDEHDKEKVINDVRNIIEKIKEINKDSYCGLPSRAYNKLKRLLSKNKTHVFYEEIESNTSFYRIRQIPNKRTNISYREMFHIPKDLRGSIKTQRYSLSGYPCLYIGKSIYGCWEEMNRPLISECWCSRLVTNENFELLDLRIPSEEVFINNFIDYIYMFPFIISCMIPVKRGEDIYKPEYILTNLFMEWVIINKKNGIIYTSTHKNKDFDYPSYKSENIAMPIQTPLENKDMCSKLCKMFKITDPANYEIEKLKEGNVIDCGGADNGGTEETYSLSNFWFVEDRLINHYEPKELD